jgi:hypothetical protein
VSFAVPAPSGTVGALPAAPVASVPVVGGNQPDRQKVLSNPAQPRLTLPFRLLLMGQRSMACAFSSSTIRCFHDCPTFIIGD